MNGLPVTDRQLDLMAVLWDQGSATVEEAMGEIEDDLAYSSVLTVFQTLEKNGHVSHDVEGKKHRYFPELSRSEVGRAGLRYLFERVYGGIPDAFAQGVLRSCFLPVEAKRALEDVREDRA